MNDYQKIASAIGYIREQAKSQPSLDDIAAQVHLSPHHFQRLFSQWAGVSPKRFLQVLTLDRAKELLHSDRTNASLLDVSDSIGLSSGSRLYDHFVQLEAVTPQEYKQQGAGLDIVWGCQPCLFGEVFVATTTRGLCKLVFKQDRSTEDLVNQLQEEWPLADISENQTEAAQIIKTVFGVPTKRTAPLSLLVRGTNFQINVWRALLDIKDGQLATYADIATKIGVPKAVRAVGTAIGANPIAYAIPCHRVIRQSGELGGYRWGLTRKHAMLAKETARFG